MRSARRLDLLFRLATRALALSPVACSVATTLPGPTIDPATLSLDVCGGTDYEPLAGLTVSPPVDYVAIIEWQYIRDPRFAPAHRSVRVWREDGTACATSTNFAKCKARLDALSPATGWLGEQYPNPPFVQALVYTRGDTVGAVTSNTALAAFFGPVMSGRDAALIAMLQGHAIVCGANARRVAGGYELITRTGYACGAGTGIDQHHVRVARDGVFTVLQTARIENGNPQCVVGRRIAGLGHPARAEGMGETVGDYLAEMSYLEAASVHAFDRLTRELRVHGAPKRLVRAAERARADEVRHAETTARLAARYGRSVEEPVIAEMTVRAMREVALENATEGCVRETFGALVGKVQSSRAADPVIARAMRQIARDETRHAALAWDVAAWIEVRLSAEDRASVAAARQEAVRTLWSDLAVDLADDVHVAAGVPRAIEAAALLDVVCAELWAA